MKRIAFFAIALITAIGFIGCSSDDGGGTSSGGGSSITGDFTGVQSGRFVVSGELVVPAGATLTLQPGTMLQFMPRAKLSVYGKLVAIADSTNPIVLTTAQTRPIADSAWLGVIFRPNAVDTSVLRYVHVLYANKYNSNTDLEVGIHGSFKGALSVDSAKVVVDRCVIARGWWDGIDAQYNAYVEVTHTVLHKSSFNAIRIRRNANVVVKNCAMTSNDDAAIRYSYPDGGTVTGGFNNLFENKTNPPRLSDPGLATEPAILPGDIAVAPQYVDAELLNFSLMPGSGMIDAGNIADGLEADGTAPDIGAYFFRQTPLEKFGRLKGTLSRNTYKMLSHCWVNAGDTLIIEPGTRIEFQGLFSLRVWGTLIADGSTGEPIVFTSGKAIPARGDWKNIYFSGAGSNNSVLKNVQIWYASNWLQESSEATGAVSVNGANIIIDNLAIREVLVDGLNLANGAGGDFTRVDINGFGMIGISCDLNVATHITKFKVQNGLGTGIQISNNSSPVLTNGIVAGNGVNGIRLYTLCTPTFNFMTIADNTYHGITVSSNSTPTLSNSILAGNGLYSVGLQESSRLTHNNNLFYRASSDTTNLLVQVENIRVIQLPRGNSELFAAPEFRGGNPVDYRLGTNSPAHGRATDGTDLGAYGGAGLF